MEMPALNTDAAMIGNTVDVSFIAFNRTVDCKVDTGATTSSLHAVNIKIDSQCNAVSFVSDVLSPNVITLPLHGTQEVHSADAGGNKRPVVALDIEIAGTSIKQASFNLNDRSGMDTKILIGQNVLQSANVVIDPKQDTSNAEGAPQRNEAAIMRAVETLIENDVSFEELVKYLQTAAVLRIRD